MLPPGTIPIVSLLRSCTNLVSLSLGAAGPTYTDLEEHNEAFLETVAWLKECKQLRVLAITNLSIDDTVLMMPILLDSSIRLISFEYDGVGFSDTEYFLPALANHTSLQFLCLKERIGTGVWNINATDVLVDSLTKLVNLTFLDVSDMVDNFSDSHIVQIANSLPKLEVWSTSGDVLSDTIWESVASLRSLRRLEFSATTIFTVNGILDFIKKLGPSNRCLFLDVGNPVTDISIEEVQLIQEKFTEVGGMFNSAIKMGDRWIRLVY